jgi:hypothetical protein
VHPARRRFFSPLDFCGDSGGGAPRSARGLARGLGAAWVRPLMPSEVPSPARIAALSSSESTLREGAKRPARVWSGSVQFGAVQIRALAVPSRSSLC